MDAAARASAATTNLNSQFTKKPRIGASAHQDSQWQSSATLTLPNLQDLSIDTDVVLPDVDDAARNRYQTMKVLGFGTYAHVEEVYDKRDKARLAMKVFRPKGSPRQREQVKLSVQKEVAILRRISGHLHIVNLRSAFAHSGSAGPIFYVLVEPVANCDLGAYYENCALQGFPEHMIDPVREWFSCLAFGLEYIHDQKIRHKGTVFWIPI
jgi:serine/threonine protein kinase